MSVTTDRTRDHLKSKIGWAVSDEYTAVQYQENAQRDFIRMVEKVAEAKSAVSTARIELREFEATLCPACDCHKEDHALSEDEDPRPAGTWVCYDCGRDEECPR